MPRIAVLDAPSNLGLRPPTPSSVPGCAKAPGALRDHGLVRRLGARDAGCHTPPRFDPGQWRPGDGVSQAGDIARYTVGLADRIGAILAADEFPLVLGGDCSIVLGSALAMRRYGEDHGGRVGLVYVDAHSDFRHPGNASIVGAAAGEALALVTGRGQADLAAIEQRRPYIRDSDVVLVGVRSADEYRMDLQAGGFAFRTAPDVRTHGANRTAQWAVAQLAECIGFWVHLDVDVLDPSVMPAVDAPDPGGIAYQELEQLLRGMLGSPYCLGLELTVFDPDFDVEGVYAADIVNTLVNTLGHLGVAPPTLTSVRSLSAEIDPDFEPPNPTPTPPVIPSQGKRGSRPRRSSATTT
jgi:arginase